MTIKLSEFLRSTLERNDIQTSKLEEEIKTIKLYLDIEKIRFEDKIKFVEELDKRCLQKQVPSMILQPLFENAVKYGVYESLEEAQIKFTCRDSNDSLRIIIENSFDTNSVAKKGAGVGIKNIRERLEKIYNQRDLLQIEKDNKVFRVIINIPNR
jgi:LytS/YehU family sensor histidine kinase